MLTRCNYRLRIACLLVGLVLPHQSAWGTNDVHRYLFIGHPRDDGPGEIVQRLLERIDYAPFDLLLLGGDYTLRGTGTRATVAYLDAVFDLASPATLAALGNHDTSHRDYFTDVTGRPRYYAHDTNGITFVVLDTTDNQQNIVGGELTLLQNTVASLSNSTHLVLIHHHIIWMADYPPLAHLKGSPLIGASSANLSGLNFYNDVYPLLQTARSNGVEVICMAGDRTGGETQSFNIEHTTADGIHFIASGLKEEQRDDIKSVVVWAHNETAGTLSWEITNLTALPLIPDEPIVIEEIHYAPAATQAVGSAFIELANHGTGVVDLAGAAFTQGISFTFPAGASLAPGERLLLAADSNRYAHAEVPVFDWPGLNPPTTGEPLWLRDAVGREIDYVPYDREAPWPLTPNGGGPSLMLLSPERDNALASSWRPSDQHLGTPGDRNIVPPEAAGAARGDSGIVFHWSNTVPGGEYLLLYASQLVGAVWQPLTETQVATDASLMLTDTNPAAGQRFYRLGRSFP